MKVEVRWDDDPFSAQIHGSLETREIDELMRLFTQWGVIEKTWGHELSPSGQFVFDAPKNLLYFELSFGEEKTDE